MRLKLYALVLFLLYAPTAHCNTLRVPQDYHTIQLALDAAQPGDTIEIAAGTYEGFYVSKESCRIVGIPGAVVAGRVNIYEPGVTLEGLTFTGGITAFYGVSVMSCVFDGDRLALNNAEGWSTIIDCVFDASALRMEYSDAVVYESMFVGCDQPIGMNEICQLLVSESEFYRNGETDGSECASVRFDSCLFWDSPLRVQGDQTSLIGCRVRGDVVMDAYECLGPNVSSEIVDCRITGDVVLVGLWGFEYAIRDSLIVGEIIGEWEDLGGNTIRASRHLFTASAR